MIIRCIYCQKKIEKNGEEIKKIIDITKDILPTDFLEMLNIAEGKTCQRDGDKERHIFVWDIEFSTNLEILKNKINNLNDKKEKYNIELTDTKDEIETLKKEILAKEEKIKSYEDQLSDIGPQIEECKKRIEHIAGIDLNAWK